MSVVRNLPKSVLLCTKQFIFSSSYNETFGKTKSEVLNGPHSYTKKVLIHVQYIIGMSISITFSVQLRFKNNIPLQCRKIN